MKHHVKRPALLLLCAAALFSILPSWSNESYQPLFSTAGFFALPETGREVYSMNPAWRFYKGPVEGAERNDFDDRSWRLVSLPDGMNICLPRPAAASTIRARCGIASTLLPTRPGEGDGSFSTSRLSWANRKCGSTACCCKVTTADTCRSSSILHLI